MKNESKSESPLIGERSAEEMTLQQAKDIVARKHHWDDWAAIRYTGMDEGMFEVLTDEAAELYASQLKDQIKEYYPEQRLAKTEEERDKYFTEWVRARKIATNQLEKIRELNAKVETLKSRCS